MKPKDLREQLRYAYDPRFRGLHQLMARRIRTILMVSNPYESFSLSRDYSLTQDIYGASQLLHLQNVPQIVTALSGQEALAILEHEHFDLVLVSGNLPDMDTPEFGRRVKAACPGLPVVMVVFDGSWFDQAYHGGEPEGIDWIFAWRGSANVLLSIMKLVEDSQNVDRDLSIASIGAILVVEDSVEHYSLILPHLYSMLMRRTFLMVPDGINESDRQVRTRVRPKVLLARTFAAALQLFDKYQASLVGVISDLHTFQEDLLDPAAGPRFLRHVAQQEPGVPILVHSSDPNSAGVAEQVGARCLHKRGSNMRAGLEQFILEDIGLGDFIFRMPDGTRITRAANLWELEHAIESVCFESLIHHVERCDFSQWFRARGETTLASVLRPVRVSDFQSVGSLRDYLVNAVSIARKEKYRGAIADFRPPEFDPDYPFLVLGRGSLGGKGRGLAFVFRQLSQWTSDDRIEGIRVRLPHTLVIGAEESDAFMAANKIDGASLGALSDEDISLRFASGQFDRKLYDCLDLYIRKMNVPLAVRSSGLLEDSHRQPLAGLYSTYMLPNNHPDPSVRLQQLATAVKLVFASAYLARPRMYLEAIGHDLTEARMAVIVQQVAGRAYGNHFYPSISGVAQSHNYYPVFQMKPEDGVATIALGLGKQVVEGGDAVRFCPRYPHVLPQFRSPAEVMRVAQRQFFALNLARTAVGLLGGADATLSRLPLSQAESDGTLALAGSVVDLEEDRIYDGIARRGSRVVSFARILKHNAFPLCPILNHLFDACRRDLGFAVEIEFAIDLDSNQSREPEFHFLQLRPLVAARERCDILLEAIDPGRIICRSQRVLGNGGVDGIRDIVYIDPVGFDRANSGDAAAVIAAVNQKLVRERRPYILIGPGRWGSFDPWIGIPVVWHQISQARVIVEVPAKDLPMEPSQGTHFFHNMTSAGIGYFSLCGNSETEFVRWERIRPLPAKSYAHGVRHLRLPQPLTVRMDGQNQQGVIALP
ncbi:MAG: hypothetical protein C0504_03075 [Candidatus Solibacter sp.]|nr:hypothetical protein [Candidatus Solibacter sp.]